MRGNTQLGAGKSCFLIILPHIGYYWVRLLSLSLLICRMGLTPPPLSNSFVPQKIESMWESCERCNVIQMERSARGEIGNSFWGRAFCMGSEFTAESFKVQLLKGAN